MQQQRWLSQTSGAGHRRRRWTGGGLFAVALATFAAGAAAPGAAVAQVYQGGSYPAYDGQYDDPPSRVGRISYVSGEVSFSPAGERDWYRAILNRPLVPGDHLYSGPDGLAEIQLGGAAVRIDDDTALQMLTLEDGYSQLELNEGTVNLTVHHRWNDDAAYEIATPMLALVVTEPGSYRVDVDMERGYTDVLVWEGAAEAYGVRSSFPLREGDAVRFYDENLRDYELYRLPRPDGFDRFVMDRDERMRRSESLRYLPQGVIGYSDLDHYGSWSRVSDYGHVWFPRDVRRDWAPYRDGHWIWQEPWGWTWVDDAPWGFAPFHYGRWAHVSGRWGWVPGPRQVRAVYAPALVAFSGGRDWNLSISVGGGSPIGWFPLGPREVYVPPYYASRDYFRRVNVSNTIINTTVVTNVYNNYYVQGVRGRDVGLSRLDYRYRSLPDAWTAVPQDVFVRGRPVRQGRIDFPRDAVGRAEVRRFAAIAPQATSLVGAVSSPSRVRPSQRVLDRQVVARREPRLDIAPFAARASMLQQNAGQPLVREQVQRIRAQRTAEARQARESVRVVGAQPQRIERSQVRQAEARELPRGAVAPGRTRGQGPARSQVEEIRGRRGAAEQQQGSEPARQPALTPQLREQAERNRQAREQREASQADRNPAADPSRGRGIVPPAQQGERAPRGRGQEAAPAAGEPGWERSERLREQAERNREARERDAGVVEREREGRERNARAERQRNVQAEEARQRQAVVQQQREQVEREGRERNAQAERQRSAQAEAARQRQAAVQQQREQAERQRSAQAEEARQRQAAMQQQREQVERQRTAQAEEARQRQAAMQQQREQAQQAEVARGQARQQLQARQAAAAAERAEAARGRASESVEAREPRGRGRGRDRHGDEEEEQQDPRRGRRGGD